MGSADILSTIYFLNFNIIFREGHVKPVKIFIVETRRRGKWRRRKDIYTEIAGNIPTTV
jgi:hypothetical protein